MASKREAAAPNSRRARPDAAGADGELHSAMPATPTQDPSPPSGAAAAPSGAAPLGSPSNSATSTPKASPAGAPSTSSKSAAGPPVSWPVVTPPGFRPSWQRQPPVGDLSPTRSRSPRRASGTAAPVGPPPPQPSGARGVFELLVGGQRPQGDQLSSAVHSAEHGALWAAEQRRLHPCIERPGNPLPGATSSQRPWTLEEVRAALPAAPAALASPAAADSLPAGLPEVIMQDGIIYNQDGAAVGRMAAGGPRMTPSVASALRGRQSSRPAVLTASVARRIEATSIGRARPGGPGALRSFVGGALPGAEAELGTAGSNADRGRVPAAPPSSAVEREAPQHLPNAHGGALPASSQLANGRARRAT